MNLVELPAINKNHLQKSRGIKTPHPCPFFPAIDQRVHLQPPSEIRLAKQIEIRLWHQTQLLVRLHLLDIRFNDGTKVVQRLHLVFLPPNEAVDDLFQLGCCQSNLRTCLAILSICRTRCVRRIICLALRRRRPPHLQTQCSNKRSEQNHPIQESCTQTSSYRRHSSIFVLHETTHPPSYA